MRRVAVTTTVDHAPRVASVLGSRALEPVVLPCIEIRPAPEPALAAIRRAAADADWIVITSPRAVRILWPDGGMPAVPVAAVGPSTAGAVRRAGGRPEIVGAGGASDLVDRLAPVSGGRTVVFPHARSADLATAARLGRAGARVEAAAAYDTVPIAPAGDPVDAAAFGSPSAVEGWCRARPLEGLVLAAMGPTTAAALRERGHPPEVVPDRPGLEPLADALARTLAERSTS